jgi:peroxiredoxin Q/BCP
VFLKHVTNFFACFGGNQQSIKKPLVVYFYPADSTPGCTVQAESFNEKVNQIRKKYGADLVGISGQGAESKQKFAEELGLTFSILADEGDEVRKEFGVPRAVFGLFPGRVTYVLDKDGKCVRVYDELADAASHVEVAIEALEEIKATKPANPLAGMFAR